MNPVSIALVVIALKLALIVPLVNTVTCERMV